jgi:RimJ/RimL family protein N-acetyltransferase
VSVLAEPRVRLRVARPSDAEVLRSVWQRTEHFTSPMTHTIEAMRERYAATEVRGLSLEPGWHELAIELVDGAVVGSVGYEMQKTRQLTAELGYMLDPDHHRRGYATEAVACLLDELFGPYKVHRAYAVTGMNNPPSIKLLEKLGFRREATYRAAWWQQDENCWIDELGYALLADEWRRAT